MKSIYVFFTIILVVISFLSCASSQLASPPATITASPDIATALNPLILTNTWEGDWFFAFAAQDFKNTHTVMTVSPDGTIMYIYARNTGARVCKYKIESENSFIVTFPNGYKLRFDLKGDALHGQDLKFPMFMVIMKQQK
jgi:hypothetical protein